MVPTCLCIAISDFRQCLGLCKKVCKKIWFAYFREHYMLACYLKEQLFWSNASGSNIWTIPGFQGTIQELVPLGGTKERHCYIQDWWNCKSNSLRLCKNGQGNGVISVMFISIKLVHASGTSCRRRHMGDNSMRRHKKYYSPVMWLWYILVFT